MTLSTIKETITAFDLKLNSLLSRLQDLVLALDASQAEAIITREDFSLGEKWARLLKVAEKAQENHSDIHRQTKDLHEIFILISQQRNELFIQSLQYKNEPAEAVNLTFNTKDLPPPPPRRQSQIMQAEALGRQSSLYVKNTASKNAGQEDFCPDFPTPPSTPPRQPGQSPKGSRACTEIEEIDSLKISFRSV
jgi:hypothetical protein